VIEAESIDNIIRRIYTGGAVPALDETRAR
jgi:hypothetical protein